MPLLFDAKLMGPVGLLLCLGCVAPRLYNQSGTAVSSQAQQQNAAAAQSAAANQTAAIAAPGAAAGTATTSNAQSSADAANTSEKKPANKNPTGSISDSLTDTIVEGGLSKKTVGRILLGKREKILPCYKSELLNNPEAQGLVLTKIDVNTSGKVVGVSVLQSDLGDINFENCLVAEIKRWKFPVPWGGKEVRISHPFRFAPEAKTAPEVSIKPTQK